MPGYLYEVPQQVSLRPEINREDPRWIRELSLFGHAALHECDGNFADVADAEYFADEIKDAFGANSYHLFPQPEGGPKPLMVVHNSLSVAVRNYHIRYLRCKLFERKPRDWLFSSSLVIDRTSRDPRAKVHKIASRGRFFSIDKFERAERFATEAELDKVFRIAEAVKLQHEI